MIEEDDHGPHSRMSDSRRERRTSSLAVWSERLAADILV